MSPAGWRFALLAGAAAGLGLAPVANLAAGSGARATLVAALAALAALASARPGGPGFRAGLWLFALAGLATLAGLAAGALRMEAIDAGAFKAAPGSSAEVRGSVAEVPRRRDGQVRIVVDTPDGRLLLSLPEPVPDLPVGRGVAASGTVRAPGDWESDYLARHGVARIVEGRRIHPLDTSRGGVASLTDAIRTRGEAALGRGTPAAEAALLRGFVLGEDDRIDPTTVTEFQRSGLAHLLAVSGQNVVLLALLAAPILALCGVPLRARLACTLALVAIYVPVTGAGPSIQRAGVMGAAGIVAALSGRPASRWYAMALAAAITLAMNPRAAGDAGWQLSFAAVAGIALWTAPLRELLGRGRERGTARAALAEGAAVTIAATLATAPLMAHHFEAVSLAALPANLIVLPAVAPLMWLGMLAAAIGQVSALPVEPLTGLAGLLAAYVAQVAHWFSQPGWAQVEMSLPSAWDLAGVYVLLGCVVGVCLSAARRRRGLSRGLARASPLGVAAAAAVALIAVGPRPAGTAPQPAPALRITVLDIGQGDAIALEPADGAPVLVDGGPPGDGLGEKLGALGIDGLAAAIVTHDQSDHAGGIADLLGTFPVERLVYARAGRTLLADARAASVRAVRLAEGSEVDSGSLRLEVLWPPRTMLDARGADPNQLALVLLARWRRFEMLLTADAEAQDVPLDPGAVDVLKVAHHGSEDEGLARLLDRVAPRLAVISVGAGNPYGHPAPETLSTLAERHIPVARTDLDGDVTIDVGRGGWIVR
jgi:competence protein ComEC